MTTRNDNPPHKDRNPDPITGDSGAHPVGVGIGTAAGGAAAGAALGAAMGPLGVVAGTIVGGVTGAFAGKEVAEAIDPTTEDEYWRQNYQTRPYVSAGTKYDEYRPAYRYGWESRSQYAGRRFDEVEPDLKSGWDKTSSTPKLTWEKAKHATRDAWDRLEHSVTGKPNQPRSCP